MLEEKEISKHTDKKLVELYKNTGNNSLIGELYKRYTRFVYLVSIKYLQDDSAAKDAVMQIFEKLFVDLKKHKVENFKSWLHVVTKNHCLLKIRAEKSYHKKQQEFQIVAEKNMETTNFLHHTNEDSDSEARLKKLETALLQLNANQKTCIELFYLQSKSYQEVADETRFPLKKVKSYIQNGKRNLKTILIESGTFSGSFLHSALLYWLIN